MTRLMHKQDAARMIRRWAAGPAFDAEEEARAYLNSEADYVESASREAYRSWFSSNRVAARRIRQTERKVVGAVPFNVIEDALSWRRIKS